MKEMFEQIQARAYAEVGYEVSDPRLPDFSWIAPTGVFSRKALDAGTAGLIDVVQAQCAALSPRGILDLCCGVGPLICWAMQRWPQARALAVDSNVLAAQAAVINVARLQATAQVDVVWGDGLTGPWQKVESQHQDDPRLPARGKIELALVNPPTHADVRVLERMLSDLQTWMAPGGRAFFVVARAGTVAGILQRQQIAVVQHPIDGYVVLEASYSNC